MTPRRYVDRFDDVRPFEGKGCVATYDAKNMVRSHGAGTHS